MEKIKNIPKIRFKGYIDEWEKDKLINKVISINTGKSKFKTKRTGKYKILGSTSVIGYDDSYDYEGDFLLTARVGANAGNLYKSSGKVKITDNTVFIQGEQLDFIYYLLNKFDIKRLSFGTGQPLVKASELKNQTLYIPLENQEKKQIGSLFKNLDEKLEIEREKHEKLVNFKKAMLENVFPKEGEKRPKIRFGGYNDDWEDYSIERLPGFKSFDKGNGLTKDDLLKNDKYNKAILYGHIFTEYGNYLSEVKFSTKKFSDKYTFSEIGDLIIPASSTTSDNSIARGLAVNIPNVIYGGDINVIRFNNDMTNVFLAYYMDNNFLKNKIFEVVQGTTIHHLYLNNIKDISVSIPSINEQKLIGSFFKNLDEKIQVSEEKITKIENFKKAMMDGLFV